MLAIKVPPLGESIVEATIARWLKQPGESVAVGETLVELETDKITVEVPAQKAGRLTRRLRNEGDVVKVDETLGELDEAGAGAAGAVPEPAQAAPRAAAAAAPAPTQAPAPTPAPVPTPAPAPEPAGRGPAPLSATLPNAPAPDARVSPAAQRTAAGLGVDASGVTGTGRGGVISKPDVLEQAARASSPQHTPAPAAPAGPHVAPPSAPSGDGRETRERMSTRRRKIAAHLLEAQHATAHLTTFNEVDMTAVMQVRDRLKERVEKEHGVKLTFMPFFVKAACLALKSYPVVNSVVDGDSIVYRHYVHMGVAVASDQGLVVPNIRDADRKGLLEIGRDMTALAKRARDGKLTMEDLTGGTFTITNGGVFGSLVSTPIINYPQVGILGLHKIQDRPVAIDKTVQIRPMMYVALSYDHRVVDGQQAVLFLVRLKELLEEPAAMLLQ